jgi:hypothetical protein
METKKQLYLAVFLTFFLVFKQEVQTLRFLPSIFLACRLMYCLFRVLIFEWERLASRVVPRPHRSQVLAIVLKLKAQKGEVCAKKLINNFYLIRA